MSEYFRILNRVEEEQADSDLNAGSKPLTRSTPSGPSRTTRGRKAAAARRPVGQRTAPVEAKAVAVADAREQAATTQPAQPERSRRSLTRPSDRNDSFARAFDNLRAIAAGGQLCSVVIAAASATETVDPVVDGLAEEACRHQLQTLTAAFSESKGQYVLSERLLYGSEPTTGKAATPTENPAISFHLGTSDLPAALTAWLDGAREAHDLLLLHGPALGHSVDAALIARATDGLVLVVEPGVTGQQDLSNAVERARSVGCKILGLVAAGARDDLPRWMRQIVGS